MLLPTWSGGEHLTYSVQDWGHLWGHKIILNSLFCYLSASYESYLGDAASTTSTSKDVPGRLFLCQKISYVGDFPLRHFFCEVSYRRYLFSGMRWQNQGWANTQTYSWEVAGAGGALGGMEFSNVNLSVNIYGDTGNSKTGTFSRYFNRKTRSLISLTMSTDSSQAPHENRINRS